MLFEGGQLDERGNGRTGITTQKRVREIVDSARGLPPNSNAWDLAAIARLAIAASYVRLPRTCRASKSNRC
jgi:hypothetical protein